MEVSGQIRGLAALLPGKNPGTHRIRGQVGPRAGLDDFGRCVGSIDHPYAM